MRKFLGSLIAAASVVSATVPTLRAPACAVGKGSVEYSKSVPDGGPFPRTQVGVCYSETAIEITFTALEEEHFFFNASQGTNDAIWEYEVMEAFVHRGTNDPQTYLEFEVNPNNVTFQAFIHNPSKVRAAGRAFDTFFVAQPLADGLAARTVLDRAARTWTSTATVPLGLFNVDPGRARGTAWRMNFFRTVVAPDTFPDQLLGAWSPPDQPSFHITPFFGNVYFV
ncbi:hypothetical protein GGS23DRAFT_479702 [Durotheca rogersii]|uniref:uncharacterized protein n=1 Tax=Durotheca rogersii TaxID=419775 RepID=UPI00221E68D5|nr:uncharacterized protein GGS23DRAFT_479702 [Durotheca rogersii]KAI5864041.1 hypothetical protein GGS23DRAFT_479702 [Durotheca rogersii]